MFQNQIWGILIRINRTELSKKTGISLNTLKPIFDDTLTGLHIKTLDRICKALDVQPGDIFQYVPKKNNEKK